MASEFTSNLKIKDVDIGSTSSEIETGQPFFEPNRGYTPSKDFNELKFNEINASEYFLPYEDYNINSWDLGNYIYNTFEYITYKYNKLNKIPSITSRFMPKGYAPGTGVRIEYSSGSGSIARSALSADSGADWLDYNVSSLNVFIVGGGGGGGNGGGSASDSGGGGGGGGPGKAIFVTTAWPTYFGTEFLTLNYTVGAGGAASSNGGYSEIRTTRNGSDRYITGGGGNAGGDGTSTARGSGGTEGSRSQLWEVNVAPAGENYTELKINQFVEFTGSAGADGGEDGNNAGGNVSYSLSPTDINFIKDNGIYVEKITYSTSSTISNNNIGVAVNTINGGAGYQHAYPNDSLYSGGGGAGGIAEHNNPTGTGGGNDIFGTASGQNASGEGCGGQGGHGGDGPQAGGTGKAGQVVIWY